MAPLSPRARAASIVERLRSSLWPVPVALIAAAVGLAFFTLWIDRQELIRGSPWWIFRGGPDGARSTLSSLATSIMTLAGVSISMTAVVLQLASNQFSPRVVRSFLRDFVIQVVVGVYVASFTFVVLVLRAIRSTEKDGLEFVAPLSVAIAILFGLLSVIVLVVFIDHIARSLQASAIVDRIAEETKDTIAHLYPDALGDPAGVRRRGRMDRAATTRRRGTVPVRGAQVAPPLSRPNARCGAKLPTATTTSRMMRPTLA